MSVRSWFYLLLLTIGILPLIIKSKYVLYVGDIGLFLESSGLNKHTQLNENPKTYSGHNTPCDSVSPFRITHWNLGSTVAAVGPSRGDWVYERDWVPALRRLDEPLCSHMFLHCLSCTPICPLSNSLHALTQQRPWPLIYSWTSHPPDETSVNLSMQVTILAFLLEQEKMDNGQRFTSRLLVEWRGEWGPVMGDN